MSETQRGRKRAPNPRKQRTLLLTDAEHARVEAAWRRFTHERMPLGTFIRLMLLAGVNDPHVWGSVYLDSGLADADETADIAEDMAALEQELKRLQVAN